MELDAYKILALPRNASDDEIRRAYHRLAREHHPDRTTAASAADFDRVQQAWEALREPAARQQHDARLRDAELLEAGARGRVEELVHRRNAGKRSRARHGCILAVGHPALLESERDADRPGCPLPVEPLARDSA